MLERVEDLTSILIAFNEAHHLDDSLSCLKKWCGKIIVIDLRSTDKSREVANAHGADVVIHPWVPYSELVYPKLPSMVPTEWMMIVDPDERILLPLAQAVIEAIKSGRFDVVCIPRENWGLGGWPRFQSGGYQQIPRVFKKGAVILQDRIHEGIKVVSQKVCKIPPKPGSTMIHLTNASIDVMIRKLNRYAVGEVEKCLKEGIQYSGWRMLYSMLREFARLYLYRRGYKDGTRGLMLSLLFVFYRFMVSAKLWEREAFPSGPEAEYERLSKRIRQPFEEIKANEEK